jgi:peptidoglycan-associated lipoprotein
MKKSIVKASRRNKVIVLSAAVMLAVLILFTGCHKKVSARPEEAPAQPVTQQPETVQQPKAPEKISEKKVESVTSSDIAPAYAEGKEGMFADIMFEYDKYDVKESYKSELQAFAAWMTKNSSATVSVEGNCDERGTNEYNLALGDRRAKAVKDYLVSLGVASSRIETISYGEEKPVCTEQSEECWAKNRRAHFVILTKAGKQ